MPVIELRIVKILVGINMNFFEGAIYDKQFVMHVELKKIFFKFQKKCGGYFTRRAKTDFRDLVKLFYHIFFIGIDIS